MHANPGTTPGKPTHNAKAPPHIALIPQQRSTHIHLPKKATNEATTKKMKGDKAP